MIRPLAVLSLALLLLSDALGICSAFRPLDIVIHDPDTGKWFMEPDRLPVSRESFNEPCGSCLDVGVSSCGFFIRSSQYISPQIQKEDGSWIENPDEDSYAPFRHVYSLGIELTRVWHQGDESTFVLVPRSIWLTALAILPTCWGISSLRCRKNFNLGTKRPFDLRAHPGPAGNESAT